MESNNPIQKNNVDSYGQEIGPIKTPAELNSKKSLRKRKFNLGSNVNRESLTNLAVILLIILGILVVFVFLPIYNSRNIRVYLLNGFEDSIKVTVNGEDHLVDPYSFKEIKLSGGEQEFQVTGAVEKTIKSDISATYWQNISPSYFKAVNPSGEAVLLKTTTTYYADTPPSTHKDEYKYVWGELIDLKKGADFIFEEFPESVSIDSDTEDRTKLDFSYSQPLDLISYIYEYNGEEEALNYIEFYLNQRNQKDSEDTWLEYYFIYGLEVPGGLKRVERVVGERLEAKETLQVHRIYQNSLEYQGRSKYLREKYDKYLDGGIEGVLDNADYNYLRGRISENIDISKKYYNKALEIDSRHGYANYAFGMISLNEGEFEEAVKHLEKAYKRDRDNYIFERYYLESLKANEDWDKLYSEVHKIRANYLTDFKLFEMELLALEMQGDKEELRHQISEFNKLEKDLHGEYAIDYTEYADIHLAVIRDVPKDMSSDYVVPTGKYYSTYYHFIKLMLEENYVSAGKLYAANEEELNTDEINLILAIVFDLNNVYVNPVKVEESYMEKFIERQKIYSKYEKSADLISLLKSDRIPTEEEVKEWELESDIKALLCYYYWIKSGGDASGEEWLQDFSLRYSYNRNIVYHFIRDYDGSEIEKI